MTLTDSERELIERALDALASAPSLADYNDALRLYEKAVCVVRERPAGTRRVRSDFNQRRRIVAQLEIGT